MKKSELLDLAKSAAKIATRAGASDARVFASRSRGVVVEWRDGKLDRIRESTTQGLHIELYVDGRYSGNSTSDIRGEEVKKYVEKAVETTRYLAPDPHRRLPDPTSCQNPTSANLQKVDAAVAAVTPENRLTVARKIEESARAADDGNRIVSVTSSVSDSDDLWVGFATNGFEASEESTSFYRAVSVSISDEDGKKPMGSSYGVTCYYADLPSEESVGRQALERAVGQLGSDQVGTGRYPVLIENRAAPTLARHLLSPLSGGALQQKRSFMEGRLGQKVGSEALTITSDPHLPRGLASAVWDDEGMVTKKRTVIEKGELQMFFLNTYYASKLGVDPTTDSYANLVWDSGDRDAEKMIQDTEEGILVTSFLGGNSNATTGDFSLGIKGYYIKDGAVVHPVSEMNIAGNHLSFWKKLAEVGNDPWTYSSNRTPTLRFVDVQCSGR
jgi:PmbA protein